MLCSAAVGWRTLQRKVQGEVLFSPAGFEFSSGKSAIEENRQIKAKIERFLTYDYLRCAF